MLPVLTKAGPIRSMRSMCWDLPETGVVDGLVHTDVVGNIFLFSEVTFYRETYHELFLLVFIFNEWKVSVERLAERSSL